MAGTPEDYITQGNALFAIELFKRLSQTEKNLILSPISVHTALSMAFQGACGTTAESLARALQIPNDFKTIAQGYESLITYLNNIKNVTLLMANKLFVDEKIELFDTFNSTVSEHFFSELQKVNFAKNIESAKIINSWIEERTKNKIKGLIAPDSLDNLTGLLMVNAIYFKGDWNKKFDKSETKVGHFHLNDKEIVNVQMMSKNAFFYYKSDNDLNAQVIKLPYTNRNVGLIIILPKDRNGIKDLKAKLATVNLGNITDNMQKRNVTVSLPRFKIESTMDLKESLTQLGLDVIFDAKKANFSRMSRGQLYVSEIVQKAFIEVNEDGAEAAAATGVIKRLIRRPPSFRANHPFVFILLASGNPIFVGQVINPNEGSQTTNTDLIDMIHDEFSDVEICVVDEDCRDMLFSMLL